MFEKEAKERAKDYTDNAKRQVAYECGFLDGVDLGYNKAKEDADKMKSKFLELCNLKDMRIAELEKANEWHFDEVPDNENDILCQIAKDEFEVGYYHKKNEVFYTTGGEYIKVIAWKEIVPPKEE